MQQLHSWDWTSVTYGPGGGADEAAQAFTYTVTGVPAATLESLH